MTPIVALCYLHTQTAPVWEITGIEFTSFKTHTAAGMSIRFPWVTRIRSNKDCNTATDLETNGTLKDITLLSTFLISYLKTSKKNLGKNFILPDTLHIYIITSCHMQSVQEDERSWDRDTQVRV